MDEKEAYHLRIVKLLKKEIRGVATAEERFEIEQWISSTPARQAVYRELLKTSNLEAERDKTLLYHPEKAWIELQRRLQTGPSEMHAIEAVPLPRPSDRFIRVWVAAAAVLLLISVGLLYDSGILFPTKTKVAQELVEVKAGGNRAVLVLSDGRSIDLDDSQSGIMMGSGEIMYNDGSVPVLSGEDVVNIKHTESFVLATPKGGTYQVTLPDGSEVWLNAGSTLRYPGHFSGRERVVELEGEAYFSVKRKERSGSLSGSATTDQPFIVKTRNQNIEVLGTEFNVTAYPEEENIKTTLVEGKVRLSRISTKGNSKMELDPGEQAIMSANGISKARVNTERYTAWRSGAISFEGKEFAEVMREVGRWYDIEIVYSNQIPSVELFGSINRSRNLSAVLTLLESSGIQYILNDRTLTIQNTNERISPKAERSP